MSFTSYSVEKLSDPPIILSILFENYSVSRDMAASDEASRAILDASDELLFTVTDITHVKFTFEDILFAATQGARGSKPLWHHPKIREMILISPSTMIKYAAKGMNSPVFGNLAIRVFDTVDEALAYCRAQLSQKEISKLSL